MKNAYADKEIKRIYCWMTTEGTTKKGIGEERVAEELSINIVDCEQLEDKVTVIGNFRNSLRVREKLKIMNPTDYHHEIRGAACALINGDIIDMFVEYENFAGTKYPKYLNFRARRFNSGLDEQEKNKMFNYFGNASYIVNSDNIVQLIDFIKFPDEIPKIHRLKRIGLCGVRINWDYAGLSSSGFSSSHA